MIFIRKTGDWSRAKAALARVSGVRLQAVEKAALQQEAHLFRRKVLEAFNTSGRSNGKAWEKNKPSVRKAKGSSKPLVDTGDLRNSVQVVRNTPWAVFVGVPNNAMAKDGTRMVSIADVHEFGKVIAILITPKMHAYVMAKMAELGLLKGKSSGTGKFRPGQVLVIRLPTRSFIRATADAHFNRLIVGERLMSRVAVMLGGAWRDQMTGRFVRGPGR